MVFFLYQQLLPAVFALLLVAGCEADDIYQGDKFLCVQKWSKTVRRYKSDAFCLLEKKLAQKLVANIKSEDKSENAPDLVSIADVEQCVSTDWGKKGLYNVCVELKGEKLDRVAWSSRKFMRPECFRLNGATKAAGDATSVTNAELCMPPGDCDQGKSCGTKQEGSGPPEGEEDDRPLNELISTGDEMVCMWKEYQTSGVTKPRACLIKADLADRASISRGSIYVSNKHACEKTADGEATGLYRICTMIHDDGRLVWSSKQHMPSECFEDGKESPEFEDVRTLRFGSWGKCAKYMAAAKQRAPSAAALLV